MAIAAGQIVLVSDVAILATLQNAWPTYPVVWSCSTTPPALGNGLLTGRFRQIGKTVDINIRLVAGSTTTFGAGDFAFTLPVAPFEESVLPAIAVDNSAASAFPVMCRLQTASPHIWRIHIPTGGRINATTPMTWAVNDALVISGTYQAA